jgi:hypothetical protein
MRKALIIASWGLVVALIIGATSYLKTAVPVSVPLQKYPFLTPESKCQDFFQEDQNSGCVGLGIISKGKTSEMFLRENRRKARRFYA